MPFQILIVDDDSPTAQLTKLAILQNNPDCDITILPDGHQTLQYLRQAEGGSMRLPDLILLDLNLPRQTGKEVLAEIKMDDHLKIIPVVVLSSSKYEVDIIESLHLYANSYLAKPFDFDTFVEMMNTVVHFWRDVVTMPGKAGFTIAPTNKFKGKEVD